MMYYGPSGHKECKKSSQEESGAKEKKSSSARKNEQRKIYEEYTGQKPTGEVHHGLPEELSDWFSGEGRNIDINSGEYFYDLPPDVHRYKSGKGIHTKSNPMGKTWNAEWKDYKKRNPSATKEDILEHLS